MNGLNPYLDRPSGFCRIQVAELEVESAGALDNLLGRRVRRLVHPAFVAGETDRAGDPGHPGGHLRPPEDFVGVGGVRRMPHVGDIKAALDNPAVGLLPPSLLSLAFDEP